MDDIVKAALAKWPHVPHCYGWLALDSRGEWYMRDDRTQAAGPFPNPKGSRIDHDKLRAFIHRNYAADERGAWFFQNGPQRVYVQLQAAPWVWRLHSSAPGQGVEVSAGFVEITSHTGLPTQVLSTWLCDQGRLFLHTPLGLGLVHTADMHLAASAVEAGLWQPQALPFADMPSRFGYVLQPTPGAEQQGLAAAGV
jgi:Protein of unknown function (DUF2946)